MKQAPAIARNTQPLSGARRKVVLRTFARAAAGRLQLMRDPGAGV
ncbi:MAG: hypothetical protein ACKO1H_00375 [Tabrizicola sp.]